MTNNSQISYRTLWWQVVVWGKIPGRSKRYFTSSVFHTGSGANPDSYSRSTKGSFFGDKWPGQEVDHSSPSSAKVQNEWSYISSPPICFHSMQRDNFTFWVSTYARRLLIVHCLQMPARNFRLFSLSGDHLHHPQLEDMPCHDDKRSTCHGTYTYKYSETPNSSVLWKQCVWTINQKNVKWKEFNIEIDGITENWYEMGVSLCK